MILATAQGMLAKFHESEVRAMGRDAGGVIGIRLLKKEGDEVVAMSVVQPGADLLVLTETGYGKRVSIDEFRIKHRGGQGVRLISLEGRKTGVVAAVQQVTELDEELVLISAQGQVVRTELDTVNRYSAERARRDRHAPERGRSRRRHRRIPSGAGGSARQRRQWRPGRESGWRGTVGRRRLVMPLRERRALGRLEDSPVYADQFQIYHGNANPDLAGKICRYLGIEPGAGQRVPVREREHLRPDPGQRPREGRVHRPADVQPGRGRATSTSRSWSS